jgi:hypothetical protein
MSRVGVVRAEGQVYVRGQSGTRYSVAAAHDVKHWVLLHDDDRDGVEDDVAQLVGAPGHRVRAGGMLERDEEARLNNGSS